MTDFNIQGQVQLTGAAAAARKAKQEIESTLGSINIGFKKSDMDFKNLGPNINKSIGPVRNLAKAFRDLQAGVDATTDGLAVMLIQTRALGGKLPSNTRAIQQNSKSVEELGKNLKQTSNFSSFLDSSLRKTIQYAKFTVASRIISGLIQVFENAIAVVVSFDDNLVKLQQITNRSATSVKLLTDEIFSLGGSLGIASGELLTATNTLAQTGLGLSKIKQLLKPIAETDLAPTFQSIEKTTEGVVAIIQQFKLFNSIRIGDEVERSLDTINELSKNFAVESSDLIEAVKRAGGVFATSAGDIEANSVALAENQKRFQEFAAIITTVRSTTRESSSTIATGIRTISARLQRVGTAEKLKDLIGIDIRDPNTGQFVGVAEAIERIADGLRNVQTTSPTFSKVIEEIAGIRQRRNIEPLITNIDKYRDALRVAQNAQGSLNEDAIKAQERLSIQLAKTQKQITKLVVEIGASKEFRELAEAFLQLARSSVTLASSLKTLLPVIIAISGAKLLKNISGRTGVGPGKLAGIGALASFAGLFNSGGLVGLTKGEMVVPPDMVRRIGLKNLEKMNRGFNSGGFFSGMVNKGSNANRDSVMANVASGSFVLRRGSVPGFNTGGAFNPSLLPSSFSQGRSDTFRRTLSELDLLDYEASKAVQAAKKRFLGFRTSIQQLKDELLPVADRRDRARLKNSANNVSVREILGTSLRARSLDTLENLRGRGQGLLKEISDNVKSSARNSVNFVKELKNLPRDIVKAAPLALRGEAGLRGMSVDRKIASVESLKRVNRLFGGAFNNRLNLSSGVGSIALAAGSAAISSRISQDSFAAPFANAITAGSGTFALGKSFFPNVSSKKLGAAALIVSAFEFERSGRNQRISSLKKQIETNEENLTKDLESAFKRNNFVGTVQSTIDNFNKQRKATTEIRQLEGFGILESAIRATNLGSIDNFSPTGLVPAPFISAPIQLKDLLDLQSNLFKSRDQLNSKRKEIFNEFLASTEEQAELITSIITKQLGQSTSIAELRNQGFDIESLRKTIIGEVEFFRLQGSLFRGNTGISDSVSQALQSGNNQELVRRVNVENIKRSIRDNVKSTDDLFTTVFPSIIETLGADQRKALEDEFLKEGNIQSLRTDDPAVFKQLIKSLEETTGSSLTSLIELGVENLAQDIAIQVRGVQGQIQFNKSLVEISRIIDELAALDTAISSSLEAGFDRVSGKTNLNRGLLSSDILSNPLGFSQNNVNQALGGSNNRFLADFGEIVRARRSLGNIFDTSSTPEDLRASIEKILSGRAEELSDFDRSIVQLIEKEVEDSGDSIINIQPEQIDGILSKAEDNLRQLVVSQAKVIENYRASVSKTINAGSEIFQTVNDLQSSIGDGRTRLRNDLASLRNPGSIPSSGLGISDNPASLARRIRSNQSREEQLRSALSNRGISGDSTEARRLAELQAETAGLINKLKELANSTTEYDRILKQITQNEQLKEQARGDTLNFLGSGAGARAQRISDLQNVLRALDRGITPGSNVSSINQGIADIGRTNPELQRQLQDRFFGEFFNSPRFINDRVQNAQRGPTSQERQQLIDAFEVSELAKRQLIDLERQKADIIFDRLDVTIAEFSGKLEQILSGGGFEAPEFIQSQKAFVEGANLFANRMNEAIEALRDAKITVEGNLNVKLQMQDQLMFQQSIKKAVGEEVDKILTTINRIVNQ